MAASDSGRSAVRRKRGEERLDCLIATTDELLDEFELRDVGLKQIAERSGVPVSSIYHYFPSREDAFAMTAHYHLLRFERLWREPLPERPATWQGLLGAKILESVRYSNRHVASMRLLFGSHFSDEIRKESADAVTLLAQVREDVLHRYFNVPPIRDLTERLMVSIACIDGILQMSFSRHGRITDEHTEEAIRATVAYLRCYLPEHLDPK